MVTLGSGSQRTIEDLLLTRYACYLIAQNGDPRKEEIAFAQSYFAVQTRKQEIIEDHIRLVKRLKARKHRKERRLTPGPRHSGERSGLPYSVRAQAVDPSVFRI